MINIAPHLIFILLTMIIGYGGAMLQSPSYRWYNKLKKPPETPHAMMFPVIWTVLYVLMGIAMGRIYKRTVGRVRRSFVMHYFIQMFFNFMWNVSFFFKKSPFLGVLNIIILDLFVLSFAIRAHHIDKHASHMFYVYLAFILFATYLDIWIFLYNK